MPTLKSVTVPVIKGFRHNDRFVSAGELLELEPVQASILARQGYVSLTRKYQTRDLTATAVEPEQPPRRRRGRPRKNTYERSDLRAEE